MPGKMTGNEYRTTIVCIDSYQESEPRGRIYNASLDGGEAFESLMQFLLRMESLLDEMKFPQSFTARREFAPAAGPLDVGSGDGERRGKLATFTVKILFRQNASWQGCVTWLERGKEESFRSALELAFLMDSAISASKQSGKLRASS